jgi:glyoxylase-like metal-dependent hydrolase (beta-lactamase superfamily II)
MLKKLVVGMYQANCYILGCKETKEGAVIDPGDEVPRIVNEATRADLTIRYILLTHGHPDHVGGVHELKRVVKAPVLIHKGDVGGLDFPPDGYLSDGQEIQVGNYMLKIIHTPGHSPGGICIHAPGVVFTGDTLFAGSIGRSDLPGASHEQLIEGVVKKIFTLGGELRVYPGHGPHTTIGRERQTNPWFRHQQ